MCECVYAPGAIDDYPAGGPVYETKTAEQRVQPPAGSSQHGDHMGHHCDQQRAAREKRLKVPVFCYQTSRRVSWYRRHKITVTTTTMVLPDPPLSLSLSQLLERLLPLRLLARDLGLALLLLQRLPDEILRRLIMFCHHERRVAARLLVRLRARAHASV